jgi:serine/threonine protein kinase
VSARAAEMGTLNFFQHGTRHRGSSRKVECPLLVRGRPAGETVYGCNPPLSMPLTAATRLGPYEIVSPLGAGGMGEVYRARDTKLDRDVALKILPDLFASDPERLARFERVAT